MPIEYCPLSVAVSRKNGAPGWDGSTMVIFEHDVRVANVVMKGCGLEFSDSEHPLKRYEVRATIEPSTRPQDDQKKTYFVKVKLALKDDSGNYDDYYSGDVDVLAIAETGIPVIGHGRVIALRSRKNGKYVRAENGGGGRLIADQQTIGDDTRFTVELVDDNSAGHLDDRSRVALRTRLGQYVCAENGGGREIVANRTAVGPWEAFMIKQLTGKTEPKGGVASVALHAYNGEVVRVDPAGNAGILSATTTRVTDEASYILTIP